MDKIIPVTVVGDKICLSVRRKLFRNFIGNSVVPGVILNPNQISAETELWLDATDASTINTGSPSFNDPVDNWNDKSGSGVNDFFQTVNAERPLVGTNEITFTTADVNLIAGGNFIFSDNTKTGLSLFAFVRITASGDSFVFDFGGIPQEGYGFFINTSRFFAYASPDQGGATIDNTSLSIDSAYHSIALVVDFNNEMKIYLDNIQVGQADITLTQLTAAEIFENSVRAASSGPMVVGRQSKTSFDSGRFLRGHMKSKVIMTEKVSSMQRSQLQQYFLSLP